MSKVYKSFEDLQISRIVTGKYILVAVVALCVLATTSIVIIGYLAAIESNIASIAKNLEAAK